MPGLILLNPGPVTLTERVRRALARPDLCHREPEFTELLQGIKRKLTRVYASHEHEPIVMTGSGTLAVEAMLATLAPDDRPTLVLANGVYGERMAAILEAHRKPFRLVQHEWTEPLDTGLDTANAGAIATVHHETTTGRLNQLRELKLPLLLDAVSSFGAEAIDFSQCAAVAATANKCLHGVPGICFVLARTSELEKPRRVGSLYLDLTRYAKDPTPFTQAVHACFALDEALDEHHEQGGWKARNARYRWLSERIGQGLDPLIPAEESSAALRAYKLKEPYEQLHRRLKEAGFVIYAGQGKLAPQIFRIAVMGDIRDEDVGRLKVALCSP